MFRATGYRRSLLPRDRQSPFRTSGTSFAPRPIRLVVATAVASLLLGNAALVYQLTSNVDGGSVRLEMPSGRAPGYQSEASELRTSLEAIEAEVRAEVGRLTVRYQETPDQRSRSEEPRAGRRDGSGSQPDGGGTASTSTGATSGGSSGGSRTTESNTGTGSGNSSGGSAGGDASNDSSTGSSGGSSGGSGGSGTGGHTGGTGGGGGGGDTSGSGDVSSGGGSGGGGGG